MYVATMNTDKMTINENIPFQINFKPFERNSFESKENMMLEVETSNIFKHWEYKNGHSVYEGQGEYGVSQDQSSKEKKK